jgi:hypothetical protein
MKNWAWVIGLAAALVTGCDFGPSTGDIEAAARQNDAEDAASGLNLGIGQYWVSTQTSRATNEYGSVAVDGQITLIDANKGSGEKVATAVDKVMGVTYVEPIDKNGFVVERVSRTTSEKWTSNSTTTDGKLSGRDFREGYVVFEAGDWIRYIFQMPPAHDQDLNPGIAVNPVAPRIDALYTDDQGEVWQGEAVEEVNGVKAVKIARQYAPAPYKLADFYKTCFTEAPGTLAGSKDVDLKPECDGTWVQGGDAVFMLEQSHSRWVGRKVALKEVQKTVELRLNALRCANNTPYVAAFGNTLANCNGTVQLVNWNGSFDGPIKVTDEQIDEVTKFGASADKKALPNIDTDAQ